MPVGTDSRCKNMKNERNFSSLFKKVAYLCLYSSFTWGTSNLEQPYEGRNPQLWNGLWIMHMPLTNHSEGLSFIISINIYIWNVSIYICITYSEWDDMTKWKSNVGLYFLDEQLLNKITINASKDIDKNC